MMLDAASVTYLASMLDRHGWPVVILICIAIIAHRFAKWAAPKADKLLDGHTRFVETITEESPKQTEAIDRMSVAVQSINNRLELIEPKVDQIHQRVHYTSTN